MTITHWDPLRDVLAIQNRVQSMLQDYGRNGEGDSLETAAFVPPVDIYEDEGKIVLTLEVPGMASDGFDVQVENGTLTVRGERKFEAADKQDNYHRVERRYGSFRRSFTLPKAADPENVQATYDAGVLRLEIAKRVEAKPRQIKVAVGSVKPQIEGSSHSAA